MDQFLAYFAGYIDGDGHFRFRKYIQDGYECFNCKIMITSTREEPLIFFKENIGGSYYAKKKSNENWKQEFIYTLHVSKSVFEKIQGLKNFLIEKRDQFELIESFFCSNKEQRLQIIEDCKLARNQNFVTKSFFNILKEIKPFVHASFYDMCYLAGYIDAEGSLTITRKELSTKRISFSCHIRVSTTKYPCIKFLLERFGGCIYYKMSKKELSNDAIQWQLTDKSIENILDDIEPFLINKRDQCNLLIDLRKTYKDRLFPRDRNFIQYYNHFTPLREQLFSKAKELNKRGL